MIPPFVQSLTRGTAPLETVFWRDMLAVGSGLNIAATAVALSLHAADYPVWLGLAVNFLPLPWNMVLLVAVWKAAEREGGPSARTANIVAALWFVVMIVL
jgi:hypothetical protein